MLDERTKWARRPLFTVSKSTWKKSISIMILTNSFTRTIFRKITSEPFTWPVTSPKFSKRLQSSKPYKTQYTLAFRWHLYEFFILAIPSRYPNYKFIFDEENAKSASLKSRYTPDSAQGVILDIYFLSQTDFLVCTFSSQVCRLAYELMQARFPDASWRFRSLGKFLTSSSYALGSSFEAEKLSFFS